MTKIIKKKSVKKSKKTEVKSTSLQIAFKILIVLAAVFVGMVATMIFTGCGGQPNPSIVKAQQQCIVREQPCKVTICHYPPGNPENVQTIDVSCNALDTHADHHQDHEGACDCERDGVDCPPPPVCGDQVCNGEETCESCPTDCGICPPPPPFCGDLECNGNETCETCSTDCGECPPPPPTCGDETCNEGETCENCATDCGECPPPPPVCGDQKCNGEETCETCAQDCGNCPVIPDGSTPDAGVPDGDVPNDAGTDVQDSGVVPPVQPPTPGQQFAVTGGCMIAGNDTSIEAVAGFALLLLVLGIALGILRIARMYFENNEKTSRRLWKWIIGVTVFAIVTLFSVIVLAFPTQNFKPAPGTSDAWTTESPKLSLPNVKLLWHYENDPLQMVNEKTGEIRDLINHRNTLHILGAYSFFDVVQVGVDIPFVIGQWNGGLLDLNQGDAEGGLANIRLMGKVLIHQWKYVGLGFGLDFGVPTSTVNYVDDDGFTFTPKIMVSGDVGPVELSMNAGVRLKDPDSFSTAAIKTVANESTFLGSVAAKWGFWQHNQYDLALVSDLYLGVPLAHSADRNLPVEWINGIHAGLPLGFTATAGAGVGLTSGVGAPDFRLLGGVGWAWDTAKHTPCPPTLLQPKYEIRAYQGPAEIVEVPVPVPIPMPILSPVYFEFDKWNLTLEAQATLMDAIDALQYIDSGMIKIDLLTLVSRADRRGNNDYNMKLAQKRAESVQTFLQENGLKDWKIELQVEGEEKSDQETKDELRLQQDRTVIIVPVVARQN